MAEHASAQGKTFSSAKSIADAAAPGANKSPHYYIRIAGRKTSELQAEYDGEAKRAPLALMPEQYRLAEPDTGKAEP